MPSPLLVLVLVVRLCRLLLLLLLLLVPSHFGLTKQELQLGLSPLLLLGADAGRRRAMVVVPRSWKKKEIKQIKKKKKKNWGSRARKTR